MHKSPWRSSAKTDIGTVRKVNEDDFFHDAAAQIWCVADGMGGHKKGDLASQLIASYLADLVKQHGGVVSVSRVHECLQSVNARLVELSQRQQAIIGSTVVVLLFEKEQAHCIWAGDSRIYRLRNNRIQRLTRDHSQVEDMVDAGLISPEEAERHPKANVITRAVGADSALELECKSYELLPNDQFLLCSDGLNKVINDEELEYLLSHNSAEKVAQQLIDKALSRHARDNVTVITVANPSAVNQVIHQTLPLDSTLPLNFQN